jgi:predicted nucleic acid-binding protein
MDIFVDTSAFYSLADTHDRHHARARAVYGAYITKHCLYTSDLVVAETWSLVQGRLGRQAAMRWWAGMRTGIVTIAFVRLADLEAGWRIAQRYDHEALSLVDCVSFALMERLGIETAFTFDHRFGLYRFGVRSERAFRVLT